MATIAGARSLGRQLRVLTRTIACSSSVTASVADASLGPARAKKSASFSQLPLSSPVHASSIFRQMLGLRSVNAACSPDDAPQTDAYALLVKRVSRRSAEPSIRDPPRLGCFLSP